MKDFVHLHLHTHYSLLDSAIRIPDLMDRLQELGMDTVAMTDHGNMYGAVNFQKAAQKSDIKPIIGCEMYINEQAFDEGVETAEDYHLTLLAKNHQGYKNLMYLNSMGWLEGHDPDRGNGRIDFQMLADNSEGLICLSGDLGGQVNQAILGGDRDEAIELARKYQGLFGDDHYYLELIDNALPEQQKCNDALIEIGDELDIPLVATNDCHYLTQDAAQAHAILMCIQLSKTTDVDSLMEHGVDQLYVRSAEEMYEAFSHVPEACENTRKIADMCDVEIPLGEIYLPQYDVPQAFIEDRGLDDPKEVIHEYFVHVSKEGLEERFQELDKLGRDYDRQVYEQRLEDEIEIIRQMDFPGYFLIVWDFIEWSHQQGIPVGPGRGSGAGSLVAYSLRITDIDPMPYDLLFERFLNPERVSMPDFDIDFCMNRRDDVIDFVIDKYGEDNCGQIITYGQMKARAVIKDVGRALNFSFGETNRIAKMFPDDPGITLQEALEQEGRLRKMRKEDERVDMLFDIALSLENVNRQAGIHAAGLVIAEDPLWEYVPVSVGAGGEPVTQYAKEEVEEAGLVKFDFLGLKTLTVIDDAVRLINQQRDDDQDDFDLDAVPIDDGDVFDLISAGDTTGVFQLESSGFQQLLKKLKPNSFEDIIAAVALYRPGPLGSGMVDDFIDRKHGRKEVEYPHPWLEEILEPTYGVMVYQEQVMKTAQVMAGYSLGEADLLRRAMGKKKEKVMKKQKKIFVEGATDKGVDEAKAEEVFDLMAYFSGYGFNKSHSAAYGLITYQTGYLKAHYPVEFMAALMTNDRDNTDKIVRFINEAKEMGIEVLPPDVNESLLDFSVVDQKIRFGLAAIKGVGAGVIESILEERSKEGPFESIYDFCSRVDLEKINKRAVEAMVKSGAFDSIGPDLDDDHIVAICEARASLFESIDSAVERGKRAQHDEEVGQSSLFGMMSEDARDEVLDESYPDARPWSERTLLGYEKELLGFYVTGHPLDRFENELGMYGVTSTTKLSNDDSLHNRSEVAAAGVVSQMREISLKSGDGRMAFVTLEDKTGEIEVIVFSSAFEEHEETLKSGVPLLIRGLLQEEGEPGSMTRRIKCNDITTLMAQREDKIKRVEVEIAVDDIDDENFDELRSVLRRHRGECQTALIFEMQTAEGTGRAELALPEEYSARPSDDLMMSVERIFGRDAVRLC